MVKEVPSFNIQVRVVHLSRADVSERFYTKQHQNDDGATNRYLSYGGSNF